MIILFIRFSIISFKVGGRIVMRYTSIVVNVQSLSLSDFSQCVEYYSIPALVWEQNTLNIYFTIVFQLTVVNS